MPEKPGNSSGYQKAVAADMERISVTGNDTIIYYTNHWPASREMHHFYIKRPGKLSFKRIWNLLKLRVSNEMVAKDIQKIVSGCSFSEIFCGETTLYRALRKAFPDKHLQVRFHNFYSVLVCRNTFLRYKLPLITRLNFFLLARLEKEILADTNVTPVFITKEELHFFRIIHPAREAYCWPVVPSTYSRPVHAPTPSKPLLVWFGGLSAHKSYGIQYFIKYILPALKKSLPEISFHLFGNGTEKLNNEARCIYGHGFYQGAGLPYGPEALYVNPDLLGGGVKLKIGDLLSAGVPFISTPFGVEGYHILSGENIMIAEIDNWVACIIEYYR